MPASQKTPNYQLPVYAEEDVTSYLQDFNPAMQKIDTQMKANADAAAAAQSDADSLDTRVTALEDAPAGVTELDSDTDVTGFENGYILINNNGKLGAIEPSGGTGTDPNAIHASGGGTFSASEEIGSTGPYNIVVDEDPAGVPITSDDVTVPESASAFAGQTVTEALESLQGGGSSGAAAENVSYDNAASGLAATNVQDAIDEINENVGSNYSTIGNERLMGCFLCKVGDNNPGNVFAMPYSTTPYVASGESKTYILCAVYNNYDSLRGEKVYKNSSGPWVNLAGVNDAFFVFIDKDGNEVGSRVSIKSNSSNNVTVQHSTTSKIIYLAIIYSNE